MKWSLYDDLVALAAAAGVTIDRAEAERRFLSFVGEASHALMRAISNLSHDPLGVIDLLRNGEAFPGVPANTRELAENSANACAKFESAVKAGDSDWFRAVADRLDGFYLSSPENIDPLIGRICLQFWITKGKRPSHARFCFVAKKQTGLTTVQIDRSLKRLGVSLTKRVTKPKKKNTRKGRV